MLPMHERKKKVAAILQRRPGKLDVEVNSEIMKPSGDENSELTEAMKDLISAMERKSPMDMAKAFKAAFEICESYPNEEYGEELEEQGE